MSFSYNFAAKQTSGKQSPLGDPIEQYSPRHQGGLLISPDAARVTKTERTARRTLFFLGMGLILSASALVISLISLALS